jgi:hypothetical protein
MAGNEAVAIQLEIKLHKPVNVEPTCELLDAVVRRWAIDGKAPRGMKIRIIDWRHPSRGIGKGGSQEAARMRFRGLLQEGRFTVRLRSN